MIKYNISNKKGQSKLDFSLVTQNHESEEKSCLEPKECEITPIKTPLVMDKDAFIEKRIIEGDTPEQAMEEWLLVKKRRGKKPEHYGKDINLTLKNCFYL